MTTHLSYPNSTIIEALCELRVLPSSEVNWTPKVPGELFRRLQQTFPGMEPVKETGIEFVVDKKTGQAFQRVVQGGPKIKYSNDDETRIVQVSPNLFCFNVVKDYPGWDQMHKSILDNWDIVSRVMKFEEIDKIGLRYINKIPISNQYPSLKHWLKPNDYIPEGIINSELGFSYRLETKISAENIVIVILASQKEGEENFILFDIDRIFTPENKRIGDELRNKLHELHEDVWKLFDSAKTDVFEEYLNRRK